MVLSQAELMRLPLLHEVDVTGIDASAGDEGSDKGLIVDCDFECGG